MTAPHPPKRPGRRRKPAVACALRRVRSTLMPEPALQELSIGNDPAFGTDHVDQPLDASLLAAQRVVDATVVSAIRKDAANTCACTCREA